MPFLNPYNFISTTGKVNGKTVADKTFSQLENSHVRHDYWIKDTYSGRFVCELECKTPTVVGKEQTQGTEQQAGTVEPYKIADEIALPANSLRGMVSAIAETLSQSALRVLDNSTYSVRKEVGHGLSAIGQLKKVKLENGDWQYKLRPLCLPSIDLRYRSTIPAKWQQLFGETNQLGHWLSAYINGYEEVGYQENRRLRPIATQFLASKPACYHAKRHQFHYAKLTAVNDNIGDSINTRNTTLHIKNDAFLLGQNLSNEVNPIITKTEFDQLNPTEQSEYTRGIIHVLGITGREKEIPTTKKHEKFIPIPKCNSYGDKEKIIPEQVIANFIAISKKCADASKKDTLKLPFLPEGYREHKGEEYWLPEHGELVYFDIDEKGEISEISYSSIWRKKIEGRVYDAFNAINRNLLPWGNEKRNPDTSPLTPAELLFGVAAEQKTDNTVNSYNFASRVKFYDAKALTAVELLPSQTLKILASPKPPSPALYFRSAQGGYIAKNELNLTEHKPNGRKFYLHHPTANVNNSLWRTSGVTAGENLKQKLSCTPIAIGTKFYFHIDFDNLSWDELSLLEKALTPAETFVHRLGLGKPLGLGSVKLKICGLFFIDRAARYKNLATPRYAKKYNSYQWASDLAARYPLENQAATDATTLTEVFSNSLIDSNTLTALTTLGNPALTVNETVSYPYTNQQSANGENEGFKWFGNNQTQTLKPVTNQLPTLNPN